MKTQKETDMEEEFDRLHKEWEERRAARDEQALIRLKNLILFASFK